MAKTLVVGVAGGTGSGKSTFAQALMQRLGDRATHIAHDNYYREHDDLTFEQRTKLNYDHPDAYETSLLIDHLQRLRKGECVEVPEYDFSRHNRSERTITVHPSPIIVVEGVLVLADKRLRELMDVKVYVDANPDVRILRRLRRDVEERGRSVQSVIDQYLTTVRPMHDEYVEPSKRFADLIVPGEGNNSVAQEVLLAWIGR